MPNTSVIAVRREIQMTSKVLVKDLMSTNVNIFENESTADQVVQAMSDCDVDYVIVVQSRKPTGIITERDVIVRMLTQGLDPSVVIARAIYTNPLVTIEETATVEEAAKLMKEWNIKHLPVACEILIFRIEEASFRKLKSKCLCCSDDVVPVIGAVVLTHQSAWYVNGNDPASRIIDMPDNTCRKTGQRPRKT